MMDELLNELTRMVGPEVTAATWKKVERAKSAFRRLEAQADAEAAKKDYVVTLNHPEHGTVKISRRALTAAEAEEAASRLAPGFTVVASEEEKTNVSSLPSV